jgi:hypothetical protein
MNKDTFWEIIAEVNSETDQNDQTAILKATEKKLLALSSADIADWHSVQKMYMDLAYRNDLWAACAATHSHCTIEGFIDFRAWLISRGKDAYINALSDPDSLASLDFPRGTADFELYGYVACDCYAQKKAIESEGLSAILMDYSLWAAQNSEKLRSDFEKFPESGVSNEQRIANAYMRVLSRKYDVYKVIKQQPLCAETTAEIMSEIKLKPDIGEDWDIPDLPRLCPRLYEKYGDEPEKSFGMNLTP